MWTLVNRKAGIVIFFYEDCEDENGEKHEGGRRRTVLKEFLGDSKIKSLQSDGYSVYMYLDDELVEVEHLCCLAHVRNKFKDAYNQGCEQARFFLEKIAALYRYSLNYLHKFWKQLFAYQNDGEYTIDNMETERAIRPMTVQRKNSLFFGSTKGAIRSAIYNTFIETCKQAKISFQQFFCRYLEELNKGRTDYENLLPMTICLKS